MIEAKRKEGETSSALMFRFSRRVKRSGVLKEVNKRRFRSRPVNQRKRRLSAIHKTAKKTELARAKRMGTA